MKHEKVPYHLSGCLHVTGKSKFIGDNPLPGDLHYLQCVLSPFAHAKIKSIDSEKALDYPGVEAVLTYKDIPGQNQIGHPTLDEPLLPEDEVCYIGQPVVLVIAANKRIAEKAAKLVSINYEELQPVLTVDDALEKGLLYIPERKIKRGDVDKAFQDCDYTLQGVVESGAQEHFYMETQRCLAVPGEENEITLYAATQSTSEAQEVAARVLGLKSKDITVDVKRLGGAFGGKERSATIWACLTALACHKIKKPVLLQLSRYEDMMATGKRHPFKSNYKIGFSKEGKIIAYSVELNANGGAYTDLSIAILERAMLHADSSYYLPHVRIIGRACRTNLPPNTAFRGFGAPQGIFVMETAIQRIAKMLNLDPIYIRQLNAYREAQPTPYGQAVLESSIVDLYDLLKKKADYTRIRQEIDLFNQKNTILKRGIGTVPVKFGISFTTAFLNQGSALAWIYTDGTISLSHGGIEMGQELNTKVAQCFAQTLGVKLERIKIESSNTKRIANASPTAASSGADINCNAAIIAANHLKERLVPIVSLILKQKIDLEIAHEKIHIENDIAYDVRKPDTIISFEELIKTAHINLVDLGAHGFYSTPGIYYNRDEGYGTPFYYFVYGCGLSIMEINTLTGENRLVDCYLIHENAKSINKEIDKGQVLGAFFQGYGLSTMEEEKFNEKGQYLALTPSTYKFPSYADLPSKIHVELVEKDCHYASALGSKGIGEPPLVYGLSTYFALQDAISAIYNHTKEVDLHMPATTESIILAIDKMR